eukprot:211007-Rhodomonas_salina.1
MAYAYGVLPYAYLKRCFVLSNAYGGTRPYAHPLPPFHFSQLGPLRRKNEPQPDPGQARA